MISKNKLKYLVSLKNKKYRHLNRQFTMEGDKIIVDTLRNKTGLIREIFASPDWISGHQNELSHFKGAVLEADPIILQKISSLETAPPVVALLDFLEEAFNKQEVASAFSVALDTVQDPGNLGTIIRTADWFGIRNIFCNSGCADIYNPKVIQASMGAILNVRVHYVDLLSFLTDMESIPGFEIRGTYMQGSALWDTQPLKEGIVVFGNESRGISPELSQVIQQRITIPPAMENFEHVESLNVATSVAVVMAFNAFKTTTL